MIDWGLQGLLSAIGIAGVWLTGDKKTVGWLLGIVYNALWIVYAIFTGQYLFILVCLVYIWVYLRGYMKWRSDAQNQSGSHETVGAEVQVPVAGSARA